MIPWREIAVFCVIGLATAAFQTQTVVAQNTMECSGEVSCAQACEDMENQLNAQNDGQTWACALADIYTEETTQTPEGQDTIHTTYWCNCVHWTAAGSDGDGPGGFRPGRDAVLIPGLPPGGGIDRPKPPKTDYQQCVDAADAAYRERRYACFGSHAGVTISGDLVPTYDRASKDFSAGDLAALDKCQEEAGKEYREVLAKCLRDERRRQGRGLSPVLKKWKK